MKRRLLIIVIALALVGLAFPIINLLAAPGGAGLLTDREAIGKDWKAVAATLEAKCLVCHSNKAELPFYASLPVASGLMKGDIAQALKHVDLVEGLKPFGIMPLSEAALAKLERALDADNMPPTKYVALHWNHGLSDAEVATLRAWIADVRATHFRGEGVAEAHANSTLQPLPLTVKLDAAKVTLGNKMYHDVRLSGDDTLSCASCHALDKGGTDQANVSTGIKGAIGPINSPTSLNSGLFAFQFWDGRATTLAEQADGPVNNPGEMGSNWEISLPKLQKDAALVAEFKAAYPDGLTVKNVLDAIATFEESLITPNCAFDRYLRGDDTALNDSEKKGLATFQKHGCDRCHVGRAMGSQSFETMGLYADYFASRGDVKEVDAGRYNATKRDHDKYKFKVPTLRNIALTFPYFHDARADTLEQAVGIMSKVNSEVVLTEAEVTDVVAFLKTLTGELTTKPL